MYDCVLDSRKMSKSISNSAGDNNNNKALLFRLFRSNDVATSNDHNAALDLLNNLNAHHVTERQGTPEWFNSRLFSFMSSGINSQFTLKFKTPRENNIQLKEPQIVLKNYMHSCNSDNNDDALENEKHVDGNDDEIENDIMFDAIANNDNAGYDNAVEKIRLKTTQ